MHCKVKKYVRKDKTETPTYIMIPSTEASALGLEHGMIVDVPTITIVKRKEG